VKKNELEEAVMWARRLKIAYFFIFWLNRAKFDRACECPANGPAGTKDPVEKLRE
jgi:hypothetical protein